MQRGKGKLGARTDGRGEVLVYEVIGDEGHEKAALADAGVTDQEYLKGVMAAIGRRRRGTRHRPPKATPQGDDSTPKHDTHSSKPRSLWRRRQK